MTDCTRGCTIARKHKTECPDDECKGCEPREARHGLLCYGCHVRLLDWLDKAQGQIGLLRTIYGGASDSAMRDELEQRRSASDGSPCPLNLAAYVTVIELTDILFGRVEMVCSDHGLTGPAMPFTPEKGARWLLAQFERLENSDDIGDWWEEFGEAMSQAHSLAPWREQLARLKGIECPECHAVALVRYGGDEFVTCQRCNAHMQPGRYAIWVRELTARRTESAGLKAARHILAGSPKPTDIHTIRDAADLLGISPFTVRSWINRGQLRPLQEDAKPLRFRERDIVECHHARITKAMHERLDALWARGERAGERFTA